MNKIQNIPLALVALKKFQKHLVMAMLKRKQPDPAGNMQKAFESNRNIRKLFEKKKDKVTQPDKSGRVANRHAKNKEQQRRHKNVKSR